MGLLLKKLMIAALLLTVTNVKGQQFQWAYGTGGWTEDYALGSAVDNLGNVYVTGHATGGSTFGDVTFQEWGCYLTKFSAQGDILWAKNFGTSDTDGLGITTDSENNSYLLGQYRHAITIDTFNLDFAEGGYKTFIMKSDPQGNVLWVKKFHGAAHFSTSIQYDGEDNIYVTGSFNGTLQVGDTSITSTSSGSYQTFYDLFIVKLNRDGEVLWARSYGGRYNDYAYDIIADQNNVYMAGSVYPREATFDDQVFNLGDEERVAHLAKFSTDGAFQWVQVVPAGAYSEAHNVSTDQQGNVLVAGNTVHGNKNSDEYIFLAKYDSKGNRIFLKEIADGSTIHSSGGSIGRKTVNIATNGMDTYFTTSTGILNVGELTSSFDNRQGMVVKFNEIGYPQWIANGGGPGHEFIRDLEVDGTALYISGKYSSLTAYFDNHEIENNSGNNDADLYIARLDDNSVNKCPEGEMLIEHAERFCTGDSTALSVPAEYAVYFEWFKDGIAMENHTRQIFVKESGQYHVKINSETRCPSISDTIIVDYQDEFTASSDIEISNLPIIDMSVSNTSVCRDVEVDLSSYFSSDYEYTWNLSEEGVLSSFNSSETVVSWPFSGKKQINLFVRDVFRNCQNEDSLYVMVNMDPIVEITKKRDTLFAPQAKNYQWYQEENPIPEDAGGNNRFLKIDTPGNYSVSVTDTNDCSGSASLHVNVITSIEYYQRVPHVLIYPNPAEGILHVEGLNFSLSNAKVLLVNSAGSVMHGYNVLTENSIEITALAKGLYFVTISHNNAQYNYRFIKN